MKVTIVALTTYSVMVVDKHNRKVYVIGRISTDKIGDRIRIDPDSMIKNGDLRVDLTLNEFRKLQKVKV